MDSFNKDKIPVPGEIYQHHKGGMYQIVTIAQHTERREEILVIYKSLQTRQIYARPLKMFMEVVVVKDDTKMGVSKIAPRFSLMEDLYS